MSKVNVKRVFKNAQRLLRRHTPEILTGIGVAGMVTSTVLAVKATPKALQLIEEGQEEKDNEPLTKVEVIKVAWKPYIPAVVTGVTSAACLIGATSVNLRRNAALAAAYNISKTALNEYKEQVVETIGEKKEHAIREKVAQKKMDKHPINSDSVVFVGNDDVLFVEPVSMRPFISNKEKIREILNDLNYKMVVGMEEYISLSEFYDEIGLSRTMFSDELGWNIGSDGQIQCEFYPCQTADGKPAFMLEYQVAPRRDFTKLM